LDRRTTNGSECTRDQHAIAGLDAEDIDGLTTREAGERQGRAGGESNIGAELRQLSRRCNRKLGVRALAIDRQLADDPVARLVVGHTASHRMDGAR
jgi:hypothetical protein